MIQDYENIDASRYDFFRVKGGAEKQIELIRDELISRGHRVVHIALEAHVGPSTRSQTGIHVESLGNTALLPFKFYRLYEIVRCFRPQVIYIRDNRNLYIAYILKRWLNIPVMYHISHDYHCLPAQYGHVA